MKNIIIVLVMVMAFTTSYAQQFFEQEVIERPLDDRSAYELHRVNIDYVNNGALGLGLSNIKVISVDHQNKTIEIEGFRTFILQVHPTKSRTIKFNVNFASRDGRVRITMTSPALNWDDYAPNSAEYKNMVDKIEGTIKGGIIAYGFNTRPKKDNNDW